ncbi:hypothetical protein DFS33DRAFT_1381177 [Desarmillaria ectypa]|nr:hypothetical protein DFS33DRAFT_1381177 [Desarmillaria ectypa]
MIVEAWIQSPWGVPPKDHVKRGALFSLEDDFRAMKFTRPALTSFAAQSVREHTEKNIKKAVQENRGLHTFTTNRDTVVKDNDFGSETLDKTIGIFQREQKLLWSYLTSLATHDARNHQTRAKNASADMAKKSSHRP